MLGKIFGLALAGTLLLAGMAQAQTRLPIVFVHGNGDTAGLWITTLWRFESNGYPRELMHAVDLRHPLARSNNDKPQAGRSSTDDVMKQLAEEVAEVRQRTGAEKVVLVGNSRGANTIRNYLKNGGGAISTDLAILCGGTNHGIIVSDDKLVGSEFNGTSAFMRDLNSTPGEVVPGVRFVTIRSTDNDKYAQPDGQILGYPGTPTGVGFDGPELKGATNIVIPKIDHREVAFGLEAFVAMYEIITGAKPSEKIVPEAAPVLNGKVSGFADGWYTNIGVADATVEIFKVKAGTGERQGEAVHRKTTAADGIWGPFTAEPDAYYEFVVAVPGQAITHIYRSPFARSSAVLNLRSAQFAKGEREAGVPLVILTRPRGYFGLERDTVLLDGTVPPGITPGIPNVSSAKRSFPGEGQRTVTALFNAETIAARTWPASENRLSVIELTY